MNTDEERGYAAKTEKQMLPVSASSTCCAEEYRGGHLSFPTILISFAASRSGCQASTKIGATPAHTGKVHTQVVSCLCFVSTERTRQASCCTSGRRELNRGGHLSFPTFLMSFAASHSGCQASTKIGATPAHTGKVHTQVVLCLCLVLTERTRQASCCTSGRRELNFALTWIAFVFGSKTWLEK